MPRRRGTSAKQRAAAKRNIVKAQRRSAELRRSGHGKNGSTNFYGKGRKGRKAAKRSAYGQRKHGLSIAQRDRRKARRKKYTNAAAKTIGAAGTAFAVYSTLYPEHSKATQKKAVAKGAKAGRDFKNTAQGAKMTYKVNRTMGHTRKNSAKGATAGVRRKIKRK